MRFNYDNCLIESGYITFKSNQISHLVSLILQLVLLFLPLINGKL